MNDGIVGTLGLTAREIDLLSRTLYDAWELARFDKTLTCYTILIALVDGFPEYVPIYMGGRLAAERRLL